MKYSTCPLIANSFSGGYREKAKDDSAEVLDISGFDKTLSQTSNKILLSDDAAGIPTTSPEHAALIDIKTDSF